MDIVDKILSDPNPVEERMRELASITRGLLVVLAGRQEWTWRLGPDTYADVKVNGPIGARELDALLRYAVVLRYTVTEKPPDGTTDPAEPAP